MRKKIPFSLKSKFVDEEWTPQLMNENPFYKKCDPELRNKVNNELWIINAVTKSIINTYKPEKVKLNINMVYQLDAFKSDGDIFDKFNDSYEITRNDKNRVSNIKMKEFIKINNINVSFPKVVNYYMSKNVIYKPCKINK